MHVKKPYEFSQLFEFITYITRTQTTWSPLCASWALLRASWGLPDDDEDNDDEKDNDVSKILKGSTRVDSVRRLDE